MSNFFPCYHIEGDGYGNGNFWVCSKTAYSKERCAAALSKLTGGKVDETKLVPENMTYLCTNFRTYIDGDMIWKTDIVARAESMVSVEDVEKWSESKQKDDSGRRYYLCYKPRTGSYSFLENYHCSKTSNSKQECMEALSKLGKSLSSAHLVLSNVFWLTTDFEKCGVYSYERTWHDDLVAELMGKK